MGENIVELAFCCVEAQGIGGGLDLDRGDRWVDLRGPGTTTTRRHGFSPVGNMESERI